MKAELKRLLAALLKLNLEKYLITDAFDNICLENNIDELWENLERYIHQQSSVAVLIPGYTGYAKNTLPLFLEELAKREDFLKILDSIFIGFRKWNKSQIDFSEVKERLLELGCSENEINKMTVFASGEKTQDTQKPLTFKRIEKTENLCFVLMPFSENFDSIYQDIISSAVKETGLDCMRADDIFNTRPIMEDVWKHIQKSRILIADLTTKNPNVFYEVGIAHALEKEVLLITQKLEDVPFDLRHYRCLIYQDSVAGGKTLKEGIIKTIKNVLKV